MKLLPIYDKKKNKIYALELNPNASIFDIYKTVIHLSNTKKKKIKVQTKIRLTPKALEFQIKMLGFKYNPDELEILENDAFKEL